MKEYLVQDVFTPSSPARANFIEREKINTRIVRALKTRGKQVIVYGHSGSGKTTLLENKLQQVYENHIKTNCMKGMTFDSILLDAFDQLEPFYIDENIASRKITIDAGVKKNVEIIQCHLSAKKETSSQSKSKRMMPPQLTGPNLAKMIGEAKYCWVLEDFHKIEGEEKEKLTQLMKVFMDLSDTYPELKIIAVGAVNTARQVVQYDSEMRRRLDEIHVPLMTEQEIAQIIKNGCRLLNVNIEDAIIKDICIYSSGVASICHQLCSLMCEDLDIYKTMTEFDEASFDVTNVTYAVSEYLEIESDTIKRAFDNALKLKDADEVIYALSKSEQNGTKINGIIEALAKGIFPLSEEYILSILEKLTTEKHGELVKHDEDSHKFSFSDPFYRTFALAFFKYKDESRTKKRLSAREINELLHFAFGAMRKELSLSIHTDSTITINDLSQSH